MGRLALHLHGDDAARVKVHQIIEGVGRLADRRDPLDLAALNVEIRSIARSLGLMGYAANAKCVANPLTAIVDTSFFMPNRE